MTPRERAYATVLTLANRGVPKCGHGVPGEVVETLVEAYEEVEQLRNALHEALDWCQPFGAVSMPPSSISELQPTKMRVRGVDRAPALARLALLANASKEPT